MQTTGLIFIPDISGFTRFVKEVEIEHSRFIIQELLEILIDANDTGLTVSEIEGDAILFYRFGEKPPLNTVYHQVEKMFTAFHKNLRDYESRRFCQCSACLSAGNLTLKVITHYGEFAEYNVRNFNKLIGKDVILAHQLLKNDIEQHEYWLVTKGLLNDDMSWDAHNKIRWIDGHKTIEDDAVSYRYTQLGYLKNEIRVDPAKKLDLTGRKKIFSKIREYNTDIITLLHTSADFTYRHRWMQGVKHVEVHNHFLPRIGMRCTMRLDSGKTTTVVANHYVFHENEISFSEIDEDTGHLSHYTFERLEDLKTKLTVDYYICDGFMSGLLFDLTKKKAIDSNMEKSLHNLVQLVDQIGDAVRIKARAVRESEPGKTGSGNIPA